MRKTLWVYLLFTLALPAQASQEAMNACRKAAGFDERGFIAADMVEPAAIELCRQAIQDHPDQPDLKAFLGRALFLNGREVESAAPIQAAAQAGSVVGWALMGVIYEYGYGVKQDITQAVAWYRKSAEQGNSTAQVNLGLMYKAGRGVEKDEAQAVSWFRKAALQGNADAQFNLGTISSPDTLPALMAALKDTDTVVRRNAADLLSIFTSPEAVPALMAALNDADAAVRRNAAVALGEIKPPEAVPALIAALKDADAAVRRKAVVALDAIKSPEAVPALIAALKDADTDVRLGAAYALGASKSPEAVPTLIAALKDVDTDMRSSAASALGEIKAPAAVPALIAAFKDSHITVRSSAASALIEIKAPEAVPALIAALKDSVETVRSMAARVLGEIKAPEAVPALIAALKDSVETVRSMAARVLGEIKAPEAVPALIAALKDSHKTVRSSAASALGEIKTPEAVPSLIAALKDADMDVSGRAAYALGWIQSPKAVPALIAALKDSVETVRSVAAWALGEIKAPEAVPALIAALKDEHITVRSMAASALIKIKAPESVPALIAALKDSDEAVRNSAASALGGSQSPKAVPALIAALKDSDESVRSSAASALIEIKSPEAVPTLIAALKDSDEAVRSLAALALGEIKAPEVVPALIAALKDSHITVRSMAASALVKIKAPESVPALVMALKDSDQTVRSLAALALGEIKAPKSVPALIAALKDSDKDVRSATALALGEIKAPEAVPALIMALKDSNEDVRLAATVLAGIESPEAVPALIAALNDSDEAVRSLVVSALGEIKSPDAVPALIEALNDTSVNVRAKVVEALGKIKSPEAVLALLTTLQQPSFRVRLTAAIYLFESSTPAPDALLSQVKPHDRAVAILLRWQRAEAHLALKQPKNALQELGVVEQDLVPWVTGWERKGTRHFFNTYTLMLKGKALLADGQPQAAVEALNAAERGIERDMRLANITDSDDEGVKRLRLLIQGTRAQAHWDSAGKDAQAAIELGRQLTLTRRIEIETHERAFLVAIRKAVGEGELEKAQALTEELITQRQRWDKQHTLASASPERQAALSQIEALQRRIADAQAKLEQTQREAQDKNRNNSADRSPIDRSDRPSSPDQEQAAKLAKLKQEQAEAKRALQQFFFKLKKDRPEVALLLGAKPTELAQLQGLLRPGQLILQYLLMEDTGYVFLIGPDTLATRDLTAGSHQLEPLVAAYRQALNGKAVCADLLRGATVKGGCQERITDPAPFARELAKRLLDPVQGNLTGVTQLTLVPNGVLHQLPFAALPLDGQPLMQRFVLNQLGSASMMSVVARQTAATGPTLALAVPQAPGWGPLDNVVAEVDAIRLQLPDTTSLIGSQAISTALKGQNLAGRPLHLATHAQAGRKEDTRLALTDRDFKLDEVWGLALDGSPRVVLSACETGLGEQMSGDEVVSLANGFLFAGAKSVVASLWPVPDAPTRELMSHFYAQIAQGKRTPEAMALAQRAMLKAGQPANAWAAFTVTGE